MFELSSAKLAARGSVEFGSGEALAMLFGPSTAEVAGAVDPCRASSFAVRAEQPVTAATNSTVGINLFNCGS
jgi:hypothetical protein